MEGDEREVVLYPRAQRDLVRMEKRYARQICADLPLLRTPPWPPGKVKKLHGYDFWEIKCGDFRVASGSASEVTRRGAGTSAGGGAPASCASAS